MRIWVVHPSDLGPAEVAAWRFIQHSTPSLGNPFLSPEFTLAVGHHRPQARVAVLADGPDVVGFFPFERRRFGIGLPIGAGLTDCQGLVHAPEVEWDPRELLRACAISAWKFDHLIAGQRPFRQWQAAVAASPVIDLSQGYQAYRANLRQKSPHFCAELDRKARKLGREVGELRFVLDTRDSSPLSTLMVWKSAQYRRTGRPDRFSEPWIVNLVESLFHTRNDHFQALLSVLYAGDVAVAAHFGLRSGEILAGWFPAYNPEFGRYSPGLLGHLRLAEEAASAGVHLIDMGKNVTRYKERLKSRELFVAEGTVTTRSPLARLHWAASTSSHWAVRQIRRHPLLFGAADKVLRGYGRVGRALRPPPQLAR